jgi:hypothetical protein
MKYQRAFEAVLWAMPADAIYRFRAAAFEDLGLNDNDIIAYSSTATPRLEALTANSTTPYIAAYTDLQKGPAVLELPPAGPDDSLYGQVVDAWQFTIADVGPPDWIRARAANIASRHRVTRGKFPKVTFMSPRRTTGSPLPSAPFLGRKNVC